MERITVLVADDHPALRRGVVDVLSEHPNIEVVGEAGDADIAIEMAHSLLPQVVLMDLSMPGVGGLAATAILHMELPSIKVVIYTVSESEGDLSTAMRYGAWGYILKDSPVEDMVQAIQDIARGEVIVSPTMGGMLLAELELAPATKAVRENSLTPREVEVLQLLADGSPNKAIGIALQISENTVKAHVGNIMDKLHIMNRTQAATYALKVGRTSPAERHPPAL